MRKTWKFQTPLVVPDWVMNRLGSTLGFDEASRSYIIHGSGSQPTEFLNRGDTLVLEEDGTISKIGASPDEVIPEEEPDPSELYPSDFLNDR